MGIILKNKAAVVDIIEKDTGKIKDLWEGLYERVLRNTRQTGLLQPGDTQEWWHLIWERLSDAAFVQAIRPSEALKEWLRNVTLEVCNKPGDEWIGPWFRGRSNPPCGQLETSHVSVAVATVYDLCPEIFTAEEIGLIRSSLKTKGQDPCKVFVMNVLARRDHINNWFMVLLNGFGATAAILGDREAAVEAVEFYKTAAAIYNSDSYGESVQYSNYATLHLSHLYEILVRYDPELEKQLDMGCYARLMPWYAASYMHMKPLEGWGDEAYPRTVNFGDSAAIFRPTADVLLQVASRAKKAYPREAGLAKWLFEQTYANTRLEPTEMATFGFINTFQFYSILFYMDTVDALAPEQAEMPLLSEFELGSIIARDSWNDVKTVLGIQGGYGKHNVTSHRHEDQNSFMLTHLKERFFADPGHCCYRLRTQAFSLSTQCHSTWSFEVKKQGKTVELNQKQVKGNIYNDTPFYNKKGIVKELDGIFAVSADAAEVYGEPVTRAERMWIAPMPNTLFIIDRIETTEPVKVKAHFVLNNRDNKLKTNVAAETKLVFRRNSAAMKFFQVMSTSDGVENKCKLSFDWGYVHDFYHPLPNQKGQGAEGSALIYNYTSSEYKTNHVMVYAIAMDAIERIKGWHIKPLAGNEFHVEPPDGSGGYSIILAANGDVKVTNRYTGETYCISGNSFEKLD